MANSLLMIIYGNYTQKGKKVSNFIFMPEGQGS